MTYVQQIKSIPGRVYGVIRLIGSIKPGVHFRRSPRPTLKSEPFGDDPQQVFDLWKGEPGKGALVFFHGGGFVRGKRFYSRALREAQEQGITAVAAGYRRVKRRDISIADAVEDAAALIHYLIEQSDSLGIDPDRIAVTGNSAGGIFALLLAMRTGIIPGRCNRVVAAASHDTPTLIDPLRFREVLQLNSIEPFWIIWSQMFKIDQLDLITTPRCQELIKSCSPELWLSKNISPVYLNYSQSPTMKEDSLSAHLHSAKFGVTFVGRAKQTGAPVILSHADSRLNVTKEEFLIHAILHGADHLDELVQF
ncbi:MAG: alpha/beta hydrolase [Verrucomicrobiales bacterium]|nr:alpha/beta hydrolase [Verrucomicrobiales bacterium]